MFESIRHVPTYVDTYKAESRWKRGCDDGVESIWITLTHTQPYTLETRQKDQLLWV